ncbi:hypothetical protein EYF80_057891 [Liparis tanakae]|uniref:Uncharacterized protein n=1 Tax=Liparis tanakae TaxID=230148 RepID=A0A4Z2ETJ1_9TELE|nr:hypothetical protein EYF80_057891 [Liparis tanakae]
MSACRSLPGWLQFPVSRRLSPDSLSPDSLSPLLLYLVPQRLSLLSPEPEFPVPVLRPAPRSTSFRQVDARRTASTMVVMNSSVNVTVVLDHRDSFSKAVIKNVIVVVLGLSINYINAALIYTFHNHQVIWSFNYVTAEKEYAGFMFQLVF